MPGIDPCYGGCGGRVAGMNFVERAMNFSCCGERLIGVLAAPASAATVGLLVVVGGPQYRVGSHRQFVLLSRALATAGVAVMRFDYRGMGDATGHARSFEDVVPDVAAAMDALQAACPAIEHIVLWGLCDAASAALMYLQATQDPRVAGVALLNPWIRSDATIAKAELKHYYGQRLLDREFWAKLMQGRVDIASAVKAIATKIRTAARGQPRADVSASTLFQDRMAEGLRRTRVPVLILLSERDLTAREFLDGVQADGHWRGLLTRANVERHDIANADHTFSTLAWRSAVEMRTLDWLRRKLLAERQ